jgi:hypothetical protein
MCFLFLILECFVCVGMYSLYKIFRMTTQAPPRIVFISFFPLCLVFPVILLFDFIGHGDAGAVLSLILILTSFIVQKWMQRRYVKKASDHKNTER